MEQGAYAAKQLREIEKDSVGSADVAAAHRDLARVVRAMKEGVPTELWPRIMAILEGREVEPMTALETAEVEEYDPMVDADDEDFDDDEDFGDDED